MDRGVPEYGSNGTFSDRMAGLAARGRFICRLCCQFSMLIEIFKFQALVFKWLNLEHWYNSKKCSAHYA